MQILLEILIIKGSTKELGFESVLSHQILVSIVIALFLIYQYFFASRVSELSVLIEKTTQKTKQLKNLIQMNKKSRPSLEL